ncbi:MAG: hypothetical protein KJ600_04645 [Nanoarchaeota archaeon]|nr:hypothetical protein [Nanoarchaeota archaeon]MBU1103817.1 hypothetical protein [Nanoarchaeota archaeon]
MMNKKGFMRVVEATIAILIIFGVLLVIVPKKTSSEEKDFSEILPGLLDELAQNLTLREELISGAKEDGFLEGEIETLLGQRIKNPSLSYSVEICELDEICYLEPYPADVEEDIYAAERVVSASIKNLDFSPKKIKIFLWQN